MLYISEQTDWLRNKNAEDRLKHLPQNTTGEDENIFLPHNLEVMKLRAEEQTRIGQHQLTNEDKLKVKTTLQEHLSITNPGHSILKKIDSSDPEEDYFKAAR